MPLMDNALTTLEEAKAYIKESDPSIDATIEFLINAASAAIENYCYRKFAEASYADEEYDGTGIRNLYLKNYPVQSITEIKVDDVILSATEYKVRKESGTVVRPKSRWQEGILNLKVSYIAGYVTPEQVAKDATKTRTLPFDLELTCKHLVMFYYKTDIADFSRTFADGMVIRPEAWPGQVRALLSTYRAVV
jgi:hypothetical protein